ncbi:hypothetical protein AVDCRST_MAG92-4674, partial [uncultured Coleofasciculus sp.]
GSFSMNQNGIFHQHLQGGIDAILLHNDLCVLSRPLRRVRAN